ncbi:MAG: PEP-CTERM sorting domain-containing protein, partial [Planctomycetota bacterium]
AIFLGIRAAEGDLIYGLRLNVRSAADDFAINRVDFTPIPEPSSLIALIAASLVGAASKRGTC